MGSRRRAPANGRGRPEPAPRRPAPSRRDRAIAARRGTRPTRNRAWRSSCSTCQDRPRRRPPQWARARPPGSLPQWAPLPEAPSLASAACRPASRARPRRRMRVDGRDPRRPTASRDRRSTRPTCRPPMSWASRPRPATRPRWRRCSGPRPLRGRSAPGRLRVAGAWRRPGRPARAVDQRGGADRPAAPQRDGRMGHRRGGDLRRAERAHAHRLPGDQGGLRQGLRPQGPRRRARGRAERLRDGAGPGRPRGDARHRRADGRGAGRRAGRAGAADRPAADRRDAGLGHRRDRRSTTRSRAGPRTRSTRSVASTTTSPATRSSATSGTR